MKVRHSLTFSLLLILISIAEIFPNRILCIIKEAEPSRILLYQTKNAQLILCNQNCAFDPSRMSHIKMSNSNGSNTET